MYRRIENNPWRPSGPRTRMHNFLFETPAAEFLPEFTPEGVGEEQGDLS